MNDSIAIHHASKREQALESLFGLMALLPLGPGALRRNSTLPERLGDHAMVFLRDGDLTQEDVSLSPVSYQWAQSASVEIYIAHPEAAARDARMDEILKSLANLVLGDPTLGGMVDYTECFPPKFEDVTPEGGTGIKACTLEVAMHYLSSHPLA